MWQVLWWGWELIFLRLCDDFLRLWWRFWGYVGNFEVMLENLRFCCNFWGYVRKFWGYVGNFQVMLMILPGNVLDGTHQSQYRLNLKYQHQNRIILLVSFIMNIFWTFHNFFDNNMLHFLVWRVKGSLWTSKKFQSMSEKAFGTIFYSWT